MEGFQGEEGVEEWKNRQAKEEQKKGAGGEKGEGHLFQAAPTELGVKNLFVQA